MNRQINEREDAIYKEGVQDGIILCTRMLAEMCEHLPVGEKKEKEKTD